MSCRKRKESSSASLDEIKELINSIYKSETLEVKLNAIQNKFDVVQADLSGRKEADEVTEIMKQNRDNIRKLKF